MEREAEISENFLVFSRNYWSDTPAFSFYKSISFYFQPIDNVMLWILILVFNLKYGIEGGPHPLDTISSNCSSFLKKKEKKKECLTSAWSEEYDQRYLTWIFPVGLVLCIYGPLSTWWQQFTYWEMEVKQREKSWGKWEGIMEWTWSWSWRNLMYPVASWRTDAVSDCTRTKGCSTS